VVRGPSDCVQQVALKFMRNRDQFIREVEVRARCNFDGRYVLGILTSYDGASFESNDQKFRRDASLKGFLEYPYCIVMEAGLLKMKTLINKQNIANADWDTIRNMTKQLAAALQHIHERGVIHADLKGEIGRDRETALKMSHLCLIVCFEFSSISIEKFDSFSCSFSGEHYIFETCGYF